MRWPVRMGHLVEQGWPAMPGPKPPEIVLSAEQRRELERLVSAQKTAQALVRRARVVLLAAMGYSNTDIAEQILMDVEAVGLWRHRWVALCGIPVDEMNVATRLADAPRPGAVPRLSTEQVCQISVRCRTLASRHQRAHRAHRRYSDQTSRR